MEMQILIDAILDQLRSVIDPETGVDVVHMKLVRELMVDSTGRVSYIFRPSSPLCPIAVPLALGIIEAVKSVPGVTGQSVTVTDFIQATELNEILLAILEE
jgi:metal-sulfur cluster biosynthetic enzyme